jgi:hypothetical protein
MCISLANLPAYMLVLTRQKKKKKHWLLKTHTERLESLYIEVTDFKGFLNLENLRLAHA